MLLDLRGDLVLKVLQLERFFVVFDLQFGRANDPSVRRIQKVRVIESGLIPLSPSSRGSNCPSTDRWVNGHRQLLLVLAIIAATKTPDK